MAQYNTVKLPTNPLILIDGSSYLYRAFHASPSFTNNKGEPTGAIYGVINMLRSLIKQFPDAPMAVIFDAKGKTFRDDIYPDYKANRPSMPDDLRLQIAPLHRLIQALGLPLFSIDGVEADDVIGTLSMQASQKQQQVLISTGDKDMAQLVNPFVTLINTMTNEVLDPDGVVAKYGFTPDLMIDYLALMGDSSDNIPGVPGIGEKTAKALIAGIGGVTQLYENLDKIATLPIRGAKSLAEKLGDNKMIAMLSYQLATIKLDVALDLKPEQIIKQLPDIPTLIELYTELNFKRWLAELEDESMAIKSEAVQPSIVALSNENRSNQLPLFPFDGEHQITAQQPTIIDYSQYDTILNESQFISWFAEIKKATLVAFDTETDGLDYMTANLIGISFAYACDNTDKNSESNEINAVVKIKAAYLPLGHDYIGAPKQLDRHWILEQLTPWLENENALKVGQHIKFDANILARYHIKLKGIAFDTMLESYVLNSTAGRHDMDSLAMRYLNHKTIAFEALVGKGKNQLTMNQIDIDQATPYAAEDAEITLRLHHYFIKELTKTPSLLAVLKEYEIPLIPVLARMEQTGVYIDSLPLKILSGELSKRLNELELEAYLIAGQQFNLGSPKQLREILFDQMKLPIVKKTPSGEPSTNEEVLQELAFDYPLPKLILENRGLAKLKSTYSDKLPQMITKSTGRVHTSYHQAITSTGRLSSTDPNLQNIPIRTEQGRRIRQAFIAPEGSKILAIDYSQIELRIMAHLSADPALVDAFCKGKDIHSATAAEVSGISIEQVTKEQRRQAKAINFGLIYGMSAFGLAKQLDIPRNVAQAYIDRYFERYPGVLRYMEETKQQAIEQGYVETIAGRRLYLNEIKASNAMRRKGAERAAINAPMQGTAADIIKKAMIDVDDWIQKEAPDKVKLLMQVHDELVFEVIESFAIQASEKISNIMAQAVQLNVPLLAESGIGDNWDEAH